MPAQRLLQEVCGKVAATAALFQSMTLQFIHHTARQGDVDPLRVGCIRHICAAGGGAMAIDPLRQLLNKVLKKRHDFVFTYHPY